MKVCGGNIKRGMRVASMALDEKDLRRISKLASHRVHSREIFFHRDPVETFVADFCAQFAVASLQGC